MQEQDTAVHIHSRRGNRRNEQRDWGGFSIFLAFQVLFSLFLPLWFLARLLCGVTVAPGRRDGLKGRGRWYPMLWGRAWDAAWFIGRGIFVLALAVLLPAHFQ